MKFEELKLPAAYPMMLEAGDLTDKVRQPCRLIGSVPGRYILVSQPAQGNRIRIGQKVVVQVMASQGIVLFSSQLESAIKHPVPMLCLLAPSRVNLKTIREAIRVEHQQPVEIKTIGLEEKRLAGSLLDISLTGAKLALEDDSLSQGDIVELILDVNVRGIQRQIPLVTRVCSKVEKRVTVNEQQFFATYGVELCAERIDEEILLAYYVYVYHLMV